MHSEKEKVETIISNPVTKSKILVILDIFGEYDFNDNLESFEKLLKYILSRKTLYYKRNMICKNRNKRPSIMMNGGKDKLFIHPDFVSIFQFLMNMEAEIETILGYQKRLLAIKDFVRTLLGVASHMKPNDDFDKHNLSFPEPMEDFLKRLECPRPVHCEFIILFSRLETLRCLWTAYDKKTNDPKVLRDASDEAIDDFIKKFCLCKKNEWYSKNSKRSGKLSVQNLRTLRNSLVHFFSVGKIGLVPFYDDEYKDLMDKTNNKVQILSPDDFDQMLRSAARLLLIYWDDGAKKSEKNGDDDFYERMVCVKNLVEKNGSKIIRKV